MPGLLQRFLPREEGFFDLFAKQAANIHVGADALHKMLSHYTGVPEQVQIVKAIEHEGDEITHALFTKLNQTFITPFDREDIYELCSRLDDVIDLIDAAASRFVLYRVDSVRSGTLDLVQVLVSATAEVEVAVRALETPQKALKQCIEINRYERLTCEQLYPAPDRHRSYSHVRILERLARRGQFHCHGRLHARPHALPRRPLGSLL